MRARRAKISDAGAIFGLIARYAEQGLLLPRTEQEIRRNISHFLVQDEKKRVVSCVALENYGADLAEIRSLADAARNARARRGRKASGFRAGRIAPARTSRASSQ